MFPSDTTCRGQQGIESWIAVFAFIIRKTEGPSPLPTFTPREEVGKVFHANEEREGLMDLGGSCVY